MNFFNTLKDDINRIVKELETEGSIPSGMVTKSISVEPPRDVSHGDVATNVAMILCKQAGMKPRDLAELLAIKMRSNPIVSKVEIAGPGFINIRLADDFWYSRLRDVLVSGNTYGNSKIGNGKKINVEFISCNPTGPMHVGHGRGAVFGDVLVRLLAKVGYDVTREFYVNDAGAQVDVLGRSVYIRYLEALGEEVGQIPEGLYPGEYLLPVAKEIATKDGVKWKGLPEKDWLEYFRQRAVDAMLDIIREDLALLGIKFDVFFSERTMIEAGKVDEVLESLEKSDLVYKGVLEPPKGKKPDNWVPRKQLLFRSTDFGDDVDRPLKKDGGSFTYFASDIAYH
ncbi:MAG: arginine--tRNA ligase, partial [Alphaproteobacteria bacterium]|nr:arginine--tRNA ligase [Alphaproteobacteria bacterium]